MISVFKMLLLVLCIALVLEAKISAGFAESVSGNCTDFNPCKNMAECIRFENEPTRVKCVCQRGFNGNLCEICMEI